MKAFFYTLFKPLLEFLAKVWNFIPNLLAAIAIIAIGYVVARVVKGIVGRGLELINFDTLVDKMGVTHILRKGDIAKEPAKIVAELLYGLILIIFVMVGIDALNLEATSQLVNLFFLYLPRLFAALIILTIGYLLADFLARAALIASVNADLPYSKTFSEAVRLLILVLVIAMALEQLSIAGTILLSAFSIAFGGLVLALALAFGLGGKDVAREILERRLRKGEEKEDIEHI